jgi:hypothetical protein
MVQLQNFINFLDDMWGHFSVNRFAKHYNCNVKRFNSLFWVLGAEQVDAFSVDWSGENNWLVAPVT